MEFLNAIWSVLLDLGPWLLLGMLIAGILHAILPPDFVRRHLTGRGAVLRAVALGVPLPLCSCGVIPVGLGLKKDGASDGAAVGFLISTPQTGVDSILVSAAFLGWPFAAFKVLSALVTGVVGGYLTDATVPRSVSRSEPEHEQRPGQARGFRPAVEHALDLLRPIWHWILFGVVASALVETQVPEDFFVGLSEAGTLVPVLAALVVSIPMYICATASVPIAAAMVAGGMPAGAALVFLMAGPATNVATIGAIFRVLGRRALTVYLATLVIGSLAAGLLLDSVLPLSAYVAEHTHHGGATWWSTAGAVILTGLIAWFAMSYLRDFVSRLRARAPGRSHPVNILVTGMTCGGCTSKLERALRDADGVVSVNVTLDPGRVRVFGSAEPERLRDIIQSVGFSVTPRAHSK